MCAVSCEVQTKFLFSSCARNYDFMSISELLLQGLLHMMNW